MNKERAIYFAGLMEEYLNIPSCVCENIENELINEKYNKVINYVIDRRKELENKANYKTHQEIINMYLELQQERDLYKEVVEELREYIEDWLFDAGGNGASMTYEDINELLQILDKVIGGINNEINK